MQVQHLCHGLMEEWQDTANCRGKSPCSSPRPRDVNKPASACAKTQHLFWVTLALEWN